MTLLYIQSERFKYLNQFFILKKIRNNCEIVKKMSHQKLTFSQPLRTFLAVRVALLLYSFLVP